MKAIFLTGLSGAGKTTLSIGLEAYFNKSSLKAILLDGDELRSGLNSNLGFCIEDRTENIRRVAEITHLLMNKGILVIVALICPTNELRQLFYNIVGRGKVIEVFVSCPLEVCISRDVKGLYAQALNNKIQRFTGVSDIWEDPITPDLILSTNNNSIGNSIAKIIHFYEKT